VQPLISHATLADDCHRAWPHLADHRSAVVAHLVRDGVPASEVQGPDLYLAVACTHADAAALGELEKLLAPVRAAMTRAHRDPALVDDALQVLRYRLLVTTPEREAKLDTYRGRGSLQGWLRVVALRQVHEMAAARNRNPVMPTDAIVEAVTETDPMLELLVRTHGDSVRRVFREALAELDERQRDVLRLEVIEGLGHQQIAERYGVHRTSALRWLEEVRATLAREVRARIRQELGLGADSVESLLRALDHRVQLSVTSGLLPAA